MDALNLAYSALVSATLACFTPSPSLTADQLVAFVCAVVAELPSSSTGPSAAVAALGELLADVLWSINYQLWLGLPPRDKSGAPTVEITPSHSCAESCRQVLVSIVQQLLVRL